MSEALTKEALYVLENQIELVQNPVEKRWELYLSADLPRPLYEELIKALKRIEGKWKGGSTRAVLFPINMPVEKQVLQMIDTKQMPPNNPNQFFGTPPLVANMMVDLSLGDDPGLDDPQTHILEPSAGRGAILDSLEEREFPGYVTAIELDPYNFSVLEASYDWDEEEPWRLFHADFLNWSDNEPHPEPDYNRVIMNPPFKAAGRPHVYVYHILLALERLANHGHLVAVVPSGWSTNSHKHCRMLRNAFKANDGVEVQLGVDAFKESGTRVSACLIELRKNWKTLEEVAGKRLEVKKIDDLTGGRIQFKD